MYERDVYKRQDLVRVNGTPIETRDATTPKKDTGPDPSRDAETPIIDSGPRCDPQKPFGPLEIAPGFDPATIVRNGVRSRDELEAYFIAGPSAQAAELRQVKRTSRTQSWSPSVAVAVTPTPNAALSLVAGGRKLYYYGCSSLSPLTCENYVITRNSTTDAFTGAGKIVAQGAQVQVDLFVVDTDDTAYFSALVMDGGAHTPIFRAPTNAGGIVFNLQEIVPVLDVISQDDRPILNGTETAIYFGSRRPGGGGSAMDIWVARRASRTQPFSEAVAVPELSSVGTDYPTWVADDDCEIYVSRADRIYLSKRPL